MALNASLQPLPAIDGVFGVALKFHGDERGRFAETFRSEWFDWVDWRRIQSNRSDSKAGVLRGLHYHFRQVDYWYVSAGSIRAGLCDLRPSSPTYLCSTTVDMGEVNPIGLFIPMGVAHGFYALSDCTLTYFVNNFYDSTDELGVAWNDPQCSVNWGVEQPILSSRDQSNPLLRDIPEALRPR
jgi:dTDP-4-dehydrorhamnose 3,5-epimerase